LGWVFLYLVSIILLGMSSFLKSGICSIDHEMRCRRTNYAVAIGVLVGFLSTAALALFYYSKMTPNISLFLSSVSAVLYGFGVVMLTSVSGPARNLGTIYFTTWIGAVLSFLLLIDSLKEMFVFEDAVVIVTLPKRGAQLPKRETVEAASLNESLSTEDDKVKSTPHASKDLIEVKMGCDTSDNSFREKFGSADKGLNSFEQEMNSCRDLLGSKHPDTLTSISNYAAFLRQHERFDQARPLYKEALAGRREVLGKNHADTLVSMNNFATFLAQQGEYNKAQSLYKEAIVGRKDTLGSDNIHTLESIRNLETMKRLSGA